VAKGDALRGYAYTKLFSSPAAV